jgi:hypothetical protein
MYILAVRQILKRQPVTFALVQIQGFPTLVLAVP